MATSAKLKGESVLSDEKFHELELALIDCGYPPLVCENLLRQNLLGFESSNVAEALLQFGRDSQAREAVMREMIVKLKSELDNLKEAFGAGKEQKIVEAEKPSKTEEIDRLRAQTEEANSRIKQMTSLVANKIGEIGELKVRLMSESNLARQKAEVERKLRGENASLQSKIAELERELTALNVEAKVVACNREHESGVFFADQLRAERAKSVQMANLLQAKELGIADLQAKIENLQRDLNRNSNQIQKWSKALDDLNARLAEHVRSLDRSRSSPGVDRERQFLRTLIRDISAAKTMIDTESTSLVGENSVPVYNLPPPPQRGTSRLAFTSSNSHTITETDQLRPL